MANFRDLTQAVASYQSLGNPSALDELEAAASEITPVPGGTAITEYQAEEEPKRPSYRDIIRNGQLFQDLVGYEAYSEPAMQAGWGESRYDKRTGFTPGMDVEDARAKAQPAVWKIGNGIIKGGITAATTAANTLAGTVFGAGAAAFNYNKQMWEDFAHNTGYNLGETLDAGVNNYVSEKLVGIQRWADEALPNYRTAEERSDEYQREWYRHVLSPNFIGDSILKNFGFTVGAIGAGSVWSKIIGKAMSAKLVNDLMKGATVAAEGDAAAIQELVEAAQAIPKGAQITVDAAKFTGNLKRAAQQINMAGSKLKLYGSAFGAMGESSMEGLMARDEYLEEKIPQIRNEYASALQGAEQEILNSDNPDWHDSIYYTDSYGQVQEHRVLTQEGRSELLRRQQELQTEFEERTQLAGELGDRLATITYSLNFPALTGADAAVFGRILSGGWKTARTLRGVRGVAGNYRGILSGMSEKAAIGTMATINALKSAGIEAGQEMYQGFVSSGLEGSAENLLTQYNDAGYDDRALSSMREWVGNMWHAGAEYLGDVKNWQEGFLGALTGLLGIPGGGYFSGERGGVPQAIAEAKGSVRDSRDAAAKLNSIVKDPNFQDRWHSYIRHLKYDNDMEDALAEDDKKKWTDASEKQLISDIMAFAKVGRLDDLKRMADSFKSKTAADAADIRDVMEGDDPSKQVVTKNKSDEEVVGSVVKRATELSDAIDEYSDIYDALLTLAPANYSDKQMEELVFTAMNIKSIERRYLDMLNKRIEAADDALTKVVGKDPNYGTEEGITLQELKSGLERGFSSQLPMGNNGVIRSMSKLAVQSIKNQIDPSDKKILAELDDMSKLSDDRYKLYDNFQKLLSGEAAAEIEEKAQTEEKKQTKAEKKQAERTLNSFDSVSSVREAYNSIKQNERKQFIDGLKKAKGVNASADEFVELEGHVRGFQSKADNEFSALYPPSSQNYLAKKILFRKMVGDLLLHDINSLSDLQKLDPSSFDSPEEMATYLSRQMSVPMGVFSQASVASMMSDIQANLRKMMKEYMKDAKVASTVSSSNKIVAEKTKRARKPPRSAFTFEEEGDEGGGAAAAPQGPAPGKGAGKQQKPTSPPTTKSTRGTDAARPTIKTGKSGQQATEEQPGLADGLQEVRGSKMFIAPSISEVSIDRMTAAFDAIGSKEGNRDDVLAEAPLVPFGEDPDLPSDRKKEGEVNNFSETSRALVERNAYNNMAKLKKGDKIKFVILEDFPKYDGKEQVLMCTEKGGRLLVLNVLGYDTAKTKYWGLKNLHSKIESEFASKGYTDGVFTFSQESTVWGFRNGIVEYYPSKTKENSIVDIEAYDPQAPIVLVHADKDGNVSLVDLVNKNKKSPEAIFGSTPNLGSRVGHIYYLANGTNGYNVPIRLGIEHFNDATKTNGNTLFDSIRSEISEIAKQAQKAYAAIEKDGMPENEEEFLGKYRKAIKTHLAALDDVLDLHNDLVTLGFNADDGRLSIKITPDYGLPEEGEEATGGKGTTAPIYLDASEITADNLISAIASLDRALNVSTHHSEAVIRDRIGEGLLTSNATALRPKGISFFAFPWWPSEGKFKSGNVEQINIKNDKVVPETTEQKTASDTEGSGNPELDAMEFQVIGDRPSELSEETRRAVNEARKGHAARMDKAKSALYQELMKANSVTNMHMNDTKLRKKLRDLGVSAPVVNFLLEGIQKEPSFRNMSPYEAFISLSKLMSFDFVKEYEKSVRRKMDKELNGFLRNYLSQYNITIKEADLTEEFGRDDVAGAFDVVDKIIWLSENPDKQNELTFPEEFAHAFVELMGSSVEYGSASDDYKYLHNTVVHTDLYARVYEKYRDIYKDENGNPDDYRIRKEAIGQALALGIVHNWNAKKLGQTEQNKGFWGQLKAWFEDIINLFKAKNSRISFEQTIDDIANEILANDTSRLDYISAQNYNLLDYEKTLENQNKADGGKAVSFMRWFSQNGALITGSLAYRRQGTVYRSKMDSLHDIDMIIPADVHGIHNVQLLNKYNFRTRNNPDFFNDVVSSPYFQKVKAQYPKMVFGNVFNNGEYITVNAVYSEDESLSKRFIGLTGPYSDRLEHFTEEERGQMYLFDFFIRTPEQNNTFIDEKNGITLVDYKTPFREKLRMGRAKDIYDYQVWKRFDDVAGSRRNPQDLLFQITSPDPAEVALAKYKDIVAKQFRSDELDRDTVNDIATAAVIISSKPSDVVSLAELALADWHESGSFGQDVADFHLILNSIFTESEKEQIYYSLSNVYGKPADEIDVYDILEDYASWRVSGVVNAKAEQDKKVLGDAFRRMNSVESARDFIDWNTPALVDSMHSNNTSVNGLVIGKVTDTNKFASLPKILQEGLLASGWTEKEYDEASEILQDKALRCIGVQ